MSANNTPPQGTPSGRTWKVNGLTDEEVMLLRNFRAAKNAAPEAPMNPTPKERLVANYPETSNDENSIQLDDYEKRDDPPKSSSTSYNNKASTTVSKKLPSNPTIPILIPDERPAKRKRAADNNGDGADDAPDTPQPWVRRHRRTDLNYWNDDVKAMFNKIEDSTRIAFLCTYNRDLVHTIIDTHIVDVKSQDINSVRREAEAKCYGNINTWRSRGIDNLTKHVKSLCDNSVALAMELDKTKIFDYFRENFSLADIPAIFDSCSKVVDITKTSAKGKRWLELSFCNFATMVKMNLDVEEGRRAKDPQFDKKRTQELVRHFSHQQGVDTLIPDLDDFAIHERHARKLEKRDNHNKKTVEYSILGLSDFKDASRNNDDSDSEDVSQAGNSLIFGV